MCQQGAICTLVCGVLVIRMCRGRKAARLPLSTYVFWIAMVMLLLVDGVLCLYSFVLLHHGCGVQHDVICMRLTDDCVVRCC